MYRTFSLVFWAWSNRNVFVYHMTDIWSHLHLVSTCLSISRVSRLSCASWMVFAVQLKMQRPICPFIYFCFPLLWILLLQTFNNVYFNLQWWSVELGTVQQTVASNRSAILTSFDMRLRRKYIYDSRRSLWLQTPTLRKLFTSIISLSPKSSLN